MLALILVIFIALLLLGCPIAMAMGISVVPFFILTPSASAVTIAQKMFAACDSFSLMAIPFFMLAGSIMEQTGIIKDMVRWAQCLVGHLRGGLAQTSTISGVVLAGVSGSANADAAALGNMLLPAMKEAGYDPGYSVVCISTAAGLGPIIPPSINMVIFCSIVGLSTGAMFSAGILPGILLACAYMIYNYLYARKNNMPRGKFCGFRVLLRTTKEAFFALLMPIIIIGGILCGIFTPTEAGVVACVYGVFYGFFKKCLNLKSLLKCCGAAALATVGCMIIIMVSTALSYVLARLGVTALIAEFCHTFITSPLGFLAFVIVINVISGCFIDANAWMMMMLPILWPIMQSYGIPELQFALVFVVSLLTGGITPPVGMYLLIICGVDGTPLKATFRYIVPFLICEFTVIILMAIFPQIAYFIPNLMGLGMA